LVALIVAREKKSSFSINENGFDGTNYRVYCSEEAHSSIEKAAKIAGFGRKNVVKISTDDNFSMQAELLEKSIIEDIERGYIPCAVVSAFGTTGSTAIDPINEIAEIASKYDLFHHVDAALAGSALILPEMRYIAEGIERADSIVFNPHKWLLTNFDCSAHYVKDKETLIRTFSITPEYLKTSVDEQVNNYRDWGIQLGRRFRALKLWFVLRYYGLEGLQNFIREHISLAKYFAESIIAEGDFELLAPVNFNTVCFRYIGYSEKTKIDEVNEKLLKTLNDSGKIYITHTKLNGKYTIRFVVGQTNTKKRHVDAALELIKQTARNLV
ncbi:MAG: pyridoxal-dependent decarboxylase, partial [Bacteroidota bacterium]